MPDEGREMRWLGERGTESHRISVPSLAAEEPKQPAKVYFSKDDGVPWFPGEVLTGQMRYKPGLLQEETEPRLTFEGTARVKRTGEIGLGNPDSVAVICRIDVSTKGTLERHHDTDNTFRFKVRIPEYAADDVPLPPTCKFTGDNFYECEVAYQLRVEFPTSTSEQVEVPVTVFTAMQARTERLLPDTHSSTETVAVHKWCCWNSGEMRAELRVKRQLCIAGASVPIRLDLWNSSSVGFKGLRFALEARFWAAHEDDARPDVLTLAQAELDREVVPAAAADGAEAHRVVELVLRLPHKSPPTFTFGGKIDVKHFVVAEPLYKTHFDMVCEYPVALTLSELRLALGGGEGPEEEEQSDEEQSASAAIIRGSDTATDVEDPRLT
eukprot:TRINITY_DN43083_c0_g1_i1.p1 TRINITY_DN43083_c0_g1~~TRINITY_DN43083_c0_g1_i1.p1  ORF type:complete len:382 (+),score=109.02 TRINITY_DN43083_c0_g1_i1:99-1244(+)